MEKEYVGKVVSTHGLKGEVKIISDFPFKDKIFKVGNSLIIDNENYTIKTYRHHKIYEMVTLNDYKDINEVQFLLKRKVYFEKDKLLLDDGEILDEELITFQVICKNLTGTITEIFQASKTNKILRINLNNKEVLIPLNSPSILKIDKQNKKLYIELIDGMML